MSTTDTTIDPREAVTEVGAAARGRVIRPGDDDYDAARTVQNGAVDRHPALIVKVADADDVARVVRHRARRRPRARGPVRRAQRRRSRHDRRRDRARPVRA